MNMSTVVYLASISNAITFTTIILSVLSAIGCALGLLMRTDSDQKVAKMAMPIVLVSVFVFVVSLPICVLYPTESAIYKMAGITDVQKAQIDANGNVLLQNSTKDSAKVQIGHK